MPKFKFQFATLQPLLTCCSEDEIRHIINGIHVVLTPGKPVRLEATDGRRAIRLDTDWEHDAEEPTSRVLSAEILRSITYKRYSGFGELCEFGDDSITLRFPSPARGFSVTFPDIQGDYPSFGIVQPDPMPTAFPDAMVFNAEYIGSMVAIAVALASRDVAPVKFVSANEPGGSPIYMIGEDRKLHAALMPMRVII